MNGVGKTTTIGKLAYNYKQEGKKVLIAASDTFRAAASEQLEIWSERAKADIVINEKSIDPLQWLLRQLKSQLKKTMIFC